MSLSNSDPAKYASEYPLPGGVEKYFDTLIDILRHILDNSTSPDDLTQWMFSSFPNASGHIAVNGYIATLGRLRLWLEQDGVYRLTPAGTDILAKAEAGDPAAQQSVIAIKYRYFLGYDVLFNYLAERPRNFDEVFEFLKAELHVEWRSRNQPTFRINWLRSLGYVQKNGSEYALTDAGRSTYRLLKSGENQPGPVSIVPPIPVANPELPGLSRVALELKRRLHQSSVAGGNDLPLISGPPVMRVSVGERVT